MPFIFIIIIIIFINKRSRFNRLQSHNVPHIPKVHFDEYRRIKIKRIDTILWTSIALLVIGLPFLIYFGKVIKTGEGPIFLIQFLQFIFIVGVSIWSSKTTNSAIEKILGKPENILLHEKLEAKEMEEKQKEFISKKEEIEEEEKKKDKQESTGMLKGPLGFISTFLGVVIWGGSTALLYNLGLRGWSILIGLVMALIFAPAIDMGLRSITGKKNRREK
ncbi:MAG: hypothetical protein KAT14_07995 [Candidatus Marinimicrobia bacterium]|nr:hypothetical protein [Candidatus Neomarinimicrobiota bacterium]